MENFSNSANITIDINSDNSKFLNDLHCNNITIKYKEDKLFFSLDSNPTLCAIDNGDEILVYYVDMPLFYFRKSILNPDILNWYLRLMVFSKTNTYNNEFSCYNESLEGICYHVEECRVETDTLKEIKKYYFIDDEMVKMSFIKANSFEDYNVKVSYDSVDDNCFELPPTAFLDITWLYKLFSIFYSISIFN